jgi:gliding motility-associated-like protein
MKSPIAPKKCLFLLCIFFFLFSISVYSQKSWSVKLDYAKAFIENKGQFNNVKAGGDVLFAVDNGSTMIYFTKKGLTYTFLKRWPKMTQEEKKIRKENRKTFEDWRQLEIDEKLMNFQTDIISFTWLNANSSVEVQATDLTSDYHSYNVKQKDGSFKNINFIKAYKKILYKNIFPKIDIEFIFHPDSGIKYSMILRPGANINNVKMKYSGNTVLTDNGDIKVNTVFGNIIDHAPVAFFKDNFSSRVPVKFVEKDNIISFELAAYDKTKTLIIDPWILTPTLPNCNGVWECERDAAGNVYIIGGDSPMKLLKYNAAGTIQWTYNTPYDTAGYWLGTFATDLNGNSYVTAGSIAKLQKISSAGGLLWSYSSPLLSADEYWNIAFNCDQTKLIIGGTTGNMTNLQGAIFDVNTSNGAILNTQVVGYGNMFGFPPIIEEVRSITSCRNARYYFLTLDTIGCIDHNFSACPTSTPLLFRENSGYALGYKCENYRPNNGNSGIMSIRANRYFVYTQNGTHVQKRSLADGSVITTAAIPGGISTTSLGRYMVGNSGIDIDTCGNVYVGSGNAIVKYDADLNFITSVATPYKVSDVAVSTAGNVVFCGTTGTNSNFSRTGYIQSESMSACKPISLYCCDANICPSGPYCNNDPALDLTPSTPGGVWSGPGIVNPSSGTFNPAVAGVGTHTIVYSMACGSDSTTIVVNNCVICPPITFTLSNIVNVDCGGTLGSFTALAEGGTDPYNYILLNSNGDTIAEFNSASGPQDFTGLYADDYILIVSDNALCPGDTSITITSPSNMALAFTSVDETCSGSCNGQLTCTVSGGIAPFLYAWSNGMGTATITNICGGNYSVTVTDATGCSKVGQGTINTGVVVNLTLTPQNETCKNSCDGQINSAVSGGKPPYTYSWSNGKTTSNISNLCANSYTLTVTDSNGCKRNATTIVGTDIIVTANFTATPSTGGVPLSVNFVYTGTGGSNFNYTFGDGSTSTDQNPFHVFDSIGVYNVILIVNSGAPDFCTDTFRVLVEVIMPSMIIVPNVFTPNNDGVNDQFLMQSKSIETFNCTVFNRWGEKVYEWTDISIGWDGRTKSGAVAAAGVYYYVIKAVGVDKQEYNLHGTVTLLR